MLTVAGDATLTDDPFVYVVIMLMPLVVACEDSFELYVSEEFPSTDPSVHQGAALNSPEVKLIAQELLNIFAIVNQGPLLDVTEELDPHETVAPSV